MTPINPPLRGDQSDSVSAALETYDALARLSFTNPAVGRDPLIIAARQRAFERLISASEAM